VKVLDTPGVHRLAVLVIARNGQEYRGATNVTVRDHNGVTQSSDAASDKHFHELAVHSPHDAVL